MRWAAVWTAAMMLGQVATAADECRDPQDQTTMNACAEDAYRTADRALNAAYAAKMAALPNDIARKHLRTAQRAWLVYRDKQCTAESAENEGGSIYPLVWFGCLKRLTEQRTATLD